MNRQTAGVFTCDLRGHNKKQKDDYINTNNKWYKIGRGGIASVIIFVEMFVEDYGFVVERFVDLVVIELVVDSYYSCNNMVVDVPADRQKLDSMMRIEMCYQLIL